MFFCNLIRSKLVSILQPWLQEEPQLELKLGLLRSQGSVTNIRFDTSALNQLLGNSAGLSFMDVRVERMNVRFSNWSVPAFTIEVHGVDVILTVRRLVEEGRLKRMQNLNNSSSYEKEILSVIDPEGTSLHDILGRISSISTERNQLMTSLLNTMIKHCKLEMHDVRLQVELPYTVDQLALVLKTKVLSVEAQNQDKSCFFRGLAGALFISRKENSLVMNSSGLEIELERKQHLNHVFLSRDVSTFIHLNDLQPVEFDLCVAEISFTFSPVDLSILMEFDILSLKEDKPTRNGRELWNIVASRIGYLTSNPKLSMYKLVDVVKLWLHHVCAYKLLLSLVGYSSEKVFKESSTRMSQDKKFSSSVKRQWELVCKIEKELPIEAVARARRIARYRAALHVQDTEHSSSGSPVRIFTKLSKKILSVLAIVWKKLYCIFYKVAYLVFFSYMLDPHGHLEVLPENPCSQCHCSLKLGKISIIVSPAAGHHHFSGQADSHIGSYLFDLHSFCLTIDSFLLIFAPCYTGQSLSFSVGDFKVVTLTSLGTPLMRSNSRKEINNYLKGHKVERSNESKAILWGEPAIHFLSENVITGSAGSTGNDFVIILENYLEELWSNWKQTCKKFEGTMNDHLENPFLLCEIKSFYMDPYLHGPDCSVWKCSSTVGKLKLDLGYSSVMSIALLLRQIQLALCWAGSKDRSRGLLLSPNILYELTEVKWGDRYKSYANELKMLLFGGIPEKNINVGVVIAGPNIRLSLKEGNSDLYLAVDLLNIELAAWPTPKAVMEEFSGESRLDSAIPQYCWLKEPRVVDMSKANSNEFYVSQGRIALNCSLRINNLNVYLEDSEENKWHQIIGLTSMTIQFSSYREYFHSFTEAGTALSMALCGVATGISIFSYIDELSIFFQVVGSIVSAVSHTLSSLGSVGGAHFQELNRGGIASANPDTNEDTQTSAAMVASLILKSTQFAIDATCEFESLDIILHHSRKNDIMEKYMASSGIKNNKKLNIRDVPDYGILISVEQSYMRVSCSEDQAEVLTDFSGMKSVIFRCQSQTGLCNNQSKLGDLLFQSLNSLYEFSISSCMFNLWIGSSGNAPFPGRVSDTVDTSSNKSSHVTQGSSLEIVNEGSRIQSCGLSQKRRDSQMVNLNVQAPVEGYLLFLNIELGEVFMAKCSVKNIILGVHQPKKLFSSLAIGGEFHTISLNIQGGLVFLETTALAMYIRGFSLYLLCIKDLFSMDVLWVHISSGEQFERIAPRENMAGVNYCTIKDSAQGTVSTMALPEIHSVSTEIKWKLVEALNMRLSQFSLVFVIEDEYGGVRELIFEADFHLNFEFFNLRRKFSLDSHLTTISARLHENCAERTANEIQVPHFTSIKSSSPVLDESSSSNYTVPQKEFLIESDPSRLSPANFHNYILKCLTASFTVEKAEARDGDGHSWLKHGWVGSGSISGFDLIISLSEIQMLLFIVTPFCEVFNVKTDSNLKQRQCSRNQAWENDSGDAIPDGSIVAIQDIDQHMYFAVEATENKYCLVGVLHHSLVGERALFRVKYHKQSMWRLPVAWFSLTSLYAKSDSGEPLRLNYRPGSGFVDISSTKDSGWALWRLLAYKPESYDSANDLEPYNNYTKNIFYLVNKCDSAVAFVDGVPEFVRKPGNPFKVKVFNDFLPVNNVFRLDKHSTEIHETDTQQGSLVDREQTSEQAINLPHINVTFNKIILTIVHELPDANDNFPLLQACVDNIQLVIQVLPSKARLICTCTAIIYHFDSQRNSWREVVHPVNMFLFYRSRFASQGSESVSQGVPAHFYFRMKQMDISLTERALDIFLFVVGKLNLAGPYAVRSSVIFANFCKVENQSCLNLLCHFYDNQYITVAGKHSTSIFLRHIALANQIPENASFVSVQLAVVGDFSTSPIHVSFLNPRVLAWRTRIVSLQDSRTFPGPFVVVDISKETEDGLSITVSPLLRIHNGTEFPMELRFQRPQQKGAESATVLLRPGDTVDDSIAVFNAIKLSGGLKKALMSLGLGNFLLSFRPEVTEYIKNSGQPVSVEWTEELKGDKAVRISGVFDKLSYRLKKAFGIGSVKSFLSTAHCSLSVQGTYSTNLHFLIQNIVRKIPVIQPDNSDPPKANSSPVALQEQKEIFILPTVQVCNLLQTEIYVLLTEKHPDLCTIVGSENIGKEATIPCGSTYYFYANPSIIYFMVTLTPFNTQCKPVNSGDWVKKLHKQKDDVHYLDINLDFDGGKYFALLRLSRGERGILEATIFTPYILQNNTDLTLFCFASNQRLPSRNEADKFASTLPPELGLLLPPQSTRSWFLKTKKVHLKLLEKKASEVLLDLDVLSVFTEVSLEVENSAGVKHVAKLGVSLKPCLAKVVVPSHLVLVVPRYVVCNESKQVVIVRQCYLEDDIDGTVVNSNEKVALQLRKGTRKEREISFFDSLIRKHRNVNEDSLIFIQFRLNEIGWSWSGPICIASLGHFFLKFKMSLDSLGNQSSSPTAKEDKLTEFASVHVLEEGSTLVLHFHRPPDVNLPYRIENFLGGASITYYQKDSSESDILASGNSVNYVWDDLNLPHKLVVQISGVQLLREINIDKVRVWRPFFKPRQYRGLGLPLVLDRKPGDKRGNIDESYSLDMLKVGFEVFADGPTRVLRICECPDSRKEDSLFQPCAKIKLKVSLFSFHLFEKGNQDMDTTEPPTYSPIMVARLGNISVDSLFTDQQKHNQIRVQSLNVDEKWLGAPFAAVVRRSQLDYCDTNDSILHIVFILLPTKSNVKQVKYSSILLQPINLNLDEETLMRLVPFWRSSLSDPNAQSQQFYFEHFEIHPIKIVASFVPGNSYSSYSSAQETLRSLLHSVIKIPAVKNKTVELNGVLVTHALVTVRELFLKCAQHYSWYTMRAIYIAKGSPLLPPAFASIFDDSASSSLDVFFDPSSGLINLPGLTLGMFKFISKSIDKRGFSGTKRYFGDLTKTMKTAGSNVLFAAVTEMSDSILKGAETSGFKGMVNGFHQGILKLAMEPSLLGSAFIEGGPDRKIKLDRSPGVDELYIEGYLQAMLDMTYKQEYLRVRVVDDQVLLKNLPPNSSLMNEIVDRVKNFLVSKALLKGESSMTSRPLHHLRGESEWKIGPTVLTLCEHLFVSFAIRVLRKQTGKFMDRIKWKEKSNDKEKQEVKRNLKWGISKFIFSGMIAYIDGRLCRCIPNAIVRRIVSGFLLSFLDKKDSD
ncbi:PREDICTED: uncharacterized protein LOC104595825 isoform X2 [Nelumbo nucifera]|uniref:Uncharacterized protein LOC104595825 isoform X2 n=1 Tax=Nelumbo nucifera TaxID=4432 RepID=A0A1U8A1Q5_NELNU|nr:PREDICTED: uncharacterized protein LOC104595825 isoform X2 [Nelumbo nucifera]